MTGQISGINGEFSVNLTDSGRQNPYLAPFNVFSKNYRVRVKIVIISALARVGN